MTLRSEIQALDAKLDNAVVALRADIGNIAALSQAEFKTLNAKLDTAIAMLHGETREVDVKLDAEIDKVYVEFAKVHARFNAMEEKLKAIDARFNAVDDRFKAVDARFDAVDDRLDAMKTSLSWVRVQNTIVLALMGLVLTIVALDFAPKWQGLFGGAPAEVDQSTRPAPWSAPLDVSGGNPSDSEQSDSLSRPEARSLPSS